MKVIRDAFSKYGEIIIAIGSSQKENEKFNPFSAEERRKMLEKTLEVENIPASIFAVPDIEDDMHYVEHVEEIIGCSPKRIITENSWTAELFSKAGYEVIMTERHFGISATQIRDMMAGGDDWSSLLPGKVVEIIEEIDGVERIKKLLG